MTVKMDGEPAEILYAGPAPGQVAGIVQINFRVPKLDAGQNMAYLVITAGLNTIDYQAFELSIGKQ